MHSIRTSVKRQFILLGFGAILALFDAGVASAQFTINPPIDVIGNLSPTNSGYSTQTYKDWGNEPSVTVNPVNPNQILISSFAGGAVFYSSNGGASWSPQFTITSPSPSVGIPKDWNFAYDSNGVLHGAVLGSVPGGFNVYVGSSASPTGSGWTWTNSGGAVNTINNPASAAGCDQPWIAVSGSNVYAAYDANGIRVATSINGGATFTQDTEVDNPGATSGSSVNAGNRIATDGAGNLYNVYTTGVATATAGVSTVSYYLNRSQDGGATWDFNGLSAAGGILVATGKSTQLDNAGTQASNNWFAGVNDLRGSIDAVAADSTGAHVYVAYGLQDGSGTDRIYLEEYHPSGGFLIGSTTLVISPAGQRAALPSLTVLANGAVVVEYETYNSTTGKVNVDVADSVDFGASVANNVQEYSFTPISLFQAWGSTASAFNREFGDYLKITSAGDNFYGTFAGLGNVNTGGINTTGLIDPFLFTGTVVTGTASPYVWARPVSGSWTTPGNWSGNSVPSSVPNAQLPAVVINAATASPLTITLDGQQTVGTLVLGNSLSSTTGYTLAPGANSGNLTFNYLGGAATITVTDGSHAISAPVVLASNLTISTSANATLAISGNVGGGGSLTKSGPGVLTLSGFDTFSGNLTVDGGSLNMPGGSISAPFEYVGYTLPGAFTQSGGINFAGNLWLGNYAGFPGTYNLNGGQLTLTGLNQGVGANKFNFSGGTFQAGATFATSVPIALTTTGNNGIFDDNGWTLTLNGALSGPGGLQKIGAGTLVVTAVNTYSGDTLVSDGILQITSGKLPADNEYVSAGAGAAPSVVLSGGTNSVNYLYLGYLAASSGTYVMNSASGPSRLSAAYEYVGYYGSGSVTQSGGSHVVSTELDLAYEPGSSGLYNLSGSGLLTTGTANIGYFGNGSFNQTGGTHTVACLNLSLSNGAGYNGSYSLSGNGQLFAANENIGYIGRGSFTQSGGNHTVSGSFYLGDNGGSYGTYNLTGGSLFAASDEHIANGGNGSFTQSGGTHTVAGGLYLGTEFETSGSYNLSGTGLLSAPDYEIIGVSGSGSFTQTGGTNSITSQILWLGYNTESTGTYNLSGSGLLSAGVEFIGLFGSGGFTQTGGTHNVSTLYVGTDSGGSGSYSLSSTGQLTVGSLIIGNSASGSFTQSGGTNTVSSSLALAQYAGSSGTYNLNGGLLSLAGLGQGSGNAKFNFGGGTLQVYGGAGFSTSVPISLTSPGSNGTFDTNGSTLTLNGALSGPGGLVKIGAGQLTLAAGNSYGGPTTLNAGVLVAANGATLSATGTGAVTLNGGTLAAGAAGGTITGLVQAGSGPHTIAPGATLASGYGTLNLLGGLTTNNYTSLQFNLNLNSVLGTGSNGDSIYGGDLINLNGSALTVNSVGGIGGVIDLLANPAQPGDYRLFHNAGGSPNLSALVTPPAGAEVYSLSTTVDSGYIDLVAAVNVSASGGTWTHNGNGSWTVGGNWSSNPAIPGGGTVTFPDVNAVAPVTVSLNGNQSAGALVFSVSNANGYTLAQGSNGALTLGTSSGGSISVLNGAHTISAPVVLAGNLAVSTSSGTSLTLSGGLYESQAGSALTLSGAGQVIFSGPGSYTGNTSVNGGTLQIIPGGQLPAAFEYVGSSTVIQTGGSNVASKEIYFGYFSDASGTLSGGQISAPIEYVGFGANGTFVQTGGTNAASSTLTIADGSFTQGSYTLSGNGQVNATNETLGWNGHANFYQNGGNNQVYYSLTIGTNTMGYANYFLNSGNLSAFIETIGDSGNGDVLQTGGNNTVAWEMDVGYNSSSVAFYSLSGGSLSVPSEYFGYNGTGTFYQNGGTNSVASTQTTPILDLGYQATGNGSYNLSGSGLLSVGFAEYIGDNGTGSFTQSGGTHTVNSYLILGNNAGSSGSYLLNSGLLSVGVGNANEVIGNSGSGSFTQTGGSHAVSGILILGQNAGGSGSYSLQDGSLSAVDEDLGVNGTGTFMQSGGTNTVGIMFLGLNGGSGTYNLSGNGQLSAYFGYEYIGASPVTGAYSGTGSFLQTGGTNSAGSLTLALGSGYSGTYTLNGGLLQLTSLAQGGGAAAFNFGGGTFQAEASIFMNLPIALTAAVGDGVFDTNGNSVTLAGPLSGPGGLQKIGAGTLTLAVSNGFTGTTLVSNGTLLLADSNSLSGSTFDSSGSGTLSFGSGINAFVFGGLQGSGSLALTDVSLVDVALTVGGNNADTTFSGNLSDGSGLGSLTKVGTGTLVLSGSNTYGGGTTVLQGAVILTNSEAVADGTSLTVGDPTLFNPPAGAGDDAVSATVPVPEPGTLALLMAGAALLVMYRKRRRRANRDRTGFGC